MPSGRKRKPTKLRILDGSGAKNPSRINENEPEPAQGSPVRPKDLDEFGVFGWDWIEEQLSHMRILTQADGPMLELYARTYSHFRHCVEGMKKTGPVIVTKGVDGVEIRRNQFATEMHKCRDSMIKMLSEMGMTPTSRARIQVMPEPDNLEERFFGKQA